MTIASSLPTDVGGLLADWAPVLGAAGGIGIILAGISAVKGRDVRDWWQTQVDRRQAAKQPPPTISAALGYPEYRPRHLNLEDSEEATTAIRRELPPPPNGGRVAGAAAVTVIDPQGVDPAQIDSPTDVLPPDQVAQPVTHLSLATCPRCRKYRRSALHECNTPSCVTADLDDELAYERAQEWDS